jgi:DNA topoisomerase-6 subunit B
MYLNRRQKVKQEGERRSVFLRYLGEVAAACAMIDDKLDRDALYAKLLHVAKRKTVEADTKLDDRGKKIEAAEEEFGENVLIVEQAEAADGD